MGVDIYSIHVECTDCGKLNAVHRKYVKYGEKLTLVCKECKAKFAIEITALPCPIQ